MSKKSELLAEKRRERRFALKMKQAEESEPVDNELPQTAPAIPEVVEKYMGDGMVSYPMAGPKSFEELDAQDAAEKQAHEVRELAWDVQDLVYNIVQCPDMDPAGKAKAISNVGKGFGSRLSDIMSGKMVEKDLDVLSAQVLLAQDDRHSNFLKRTIESVFKSKLTSDQENALADADFALVRDAGDEKVRKYPIHEKAYVRNALARAAQEIKAGGPEAEDARAALPKIHEAAKKLGIGANTQKDKTAIVIEKDASGSWRWVGWYTNKFIDSDHDIFAEVAHKEYESWLDDHPQFSPVFLSWHTPGTARKNATDFIHYENGFMMVSGKLEDDEAAALMTVMKEESIGMSHSSFVLERDPNDPRVILKYRTFEVSDLPVSRAANQFTAIPELIFKEADMFDKKGYLATILGSADKADAYLTAAGMLGKSLSDAGVESKETTPEPKTPETPIPSLEETVAQVIKEKFGIDDFSAWVTKANEALEKLPALEVALKTASADQDKRLADLIAPRSAQAAIQKDLRPSQSPAGEVDKADPLASATPGIPDDAWLSKATGTMPLPQEV